MTSPPPGFNKLIRVLKEAPPGQPDCTPTLEARRPGIKPEARSLTFGRPSTTFPRCLFLPVRGGEAPFEEAEEHGVLAVTPGRELCCCSVLG